MYQSDYTIEGRILEYASDSSQDNVKITLSLLGEHTAENISSDINAQLKANSYLNSDRSSFSYSQNKFTININVDRTKVFNNKNIKSAVYFTEDVLYPPIYFGLNSLFKFDSSLNELNNMISETKSLRTEYKISSSPYILLSSKSSRYSTVEQKIKVANATYTLDTYIASINESFRTLKTMTNNSFDDSIDADTEPSILCKINSQIPYKNGSVKNFEIVITGSFIHKLLKFQNNEINSSATNVFTSFFNASESGVVIDSDNISIRSVGIHNSTVPLTNIKFINTTKSFNLQQLQRSVNAFLTHIMIRII